MKYDRIVRDVRRQIQQGKYHTDGKLPSENMLAKEYQVSRQTVRKAIKKLEEQGFVYAIHGSGTFVAQRALPHRETKNIAVITTYVTDYIFPRVIQGINRALTENGYSILLKTTGNSRKAESLCIEEMLAKNIDGMIIEPSQSQLSCRHKVLYEQMEENQIPYVFIQGCFREMLTSPHVMLDDELGGAMITEYLLDHGHKKIAGIFKADDMQGQRRHNGYAKALQQRGYVYNPDLVQWFHTQDRGMKPAEMVEYLIDQQLEVDGIVCYNDEIAWEVIRSLKERGIHVPKDISVTGFDHSFLSKNRQITTVSHPQEELGYQAAEMLMHLLQKKEEPIELHRMLTPEIVQGQTVKDRRKK